jgi:hypothetical protein
VIPDQTERVIQAASEIKQTGATGADTREFETLEKQLDEVKQRLENPAVSSEDLEGLENLVEKFRYEINLYFCKTTTTGEGLSISPTKQLFSLKMGPVLSPKECFIYRLLIIVFIN